MGLETAALVMAGVAVASEAGKLICDGNRRQHKTNSKRWNCRSKELQLQTQEKTLSNYDVMEKVIQAQEAHMTTTGLAFSSPRDFNAIQRETLNINARKQKNIDIEGELAQGKILIPRKRMCATRSMRSYLVMLLETAFAIGNVYSKAPKSLPQLEG